jgi:hypothetical protein
MGDAESASRAETPLLKRARVEDGAGAKGQARRAAPAFLPGPVVSAISAVADPHPVDGARAAEDLAMQSAVLAVASHLKTEHGVRERWDFHVEVALVATCAMYRELTWGLPNGDASAISDGLDMMRLAAGHCGMTGNSLFSSCIAQHDREIVNLMDCLRRTFPLLGYCVCVYGEKPDRPC